MKLLLRLLVNVLALFVVDYILPGFGLLNLQTAIVAAIIIGVVNTFIRPLAQLVTLPLTILTFGLAAIVVNVLLLWGTSMVVPGFSIDSFMTALVASILLSLVSWFLQKLAWD